MTDYKALGADKKIIAGILGILLGGFGVHKFILGYTTEGIIQIVITRTLSKCPPELAMRDLVSRTVGASRLLTLLG
jgi:TM2 domain-containing protein